MNDEADDFMDDLVDCISIQSDPEEIVQTEY